MGNNKNCCIVHLISCANISLKNGFLGTPGICTGRCYLSIFLFFLQPTISGEIQSPMGVASVEFIDPREPIMVSLRVIICLDILLINFFWGIQYDFRASGAS